MITKKQAAWARREMDRLDGLPRQAGAVRADCMGQLLVVTDWDIAWWSDARRMLTAYLAEPVAAEPIVAEPIADLAEPAS